MPLTEAALAEAEQIAYRAGYQAACDASRPPIIARSWTRQDTRQGLLALLGLFMLGLAGTWVCACLLAMFD